MIIITASAEPFVIRWQSQQSESLGLLQQKSVPVCACLVLLFCFVVLPLPVLKLQLLFLSCVLFPVLDPRCCQRHDATRTIAIGCDNTVESKSTSLRRKASEIPSGPGVTLNVDLNSQVPFHNLGLTTQILRYQWDSASPYSVKFLQRL